MRSPTTCFIAVFACVACGDMSGQMDPATSVLSQRALESSADSIVTDFDGSPAVKGRVMRLPFRRSDAYDRSGTYYIPKRTTTDGRRILVLFHGYRSSGDYMVRLLQPYADAHKIALVALDSASDQWQVPRRGAATADSRYARFTLTWLTRAVDNVDYEHVGSLGHSFGTRMAAAMGTNPSPFTAMMMAHGRYHEESIGDHRVPFWMSGSPADNVFNYKVMVQQHAEFNRTHRNWPGGGAKLNSYTCGNCQHIPRQRELTEMTDWFVSRPRH